MSQRISPGILLLIIMAACAVLAPLVIAGGASTTTGGVGITLNKTDSTDPADASTQMVYTILVNITNLEHGVSNISNLTLTDTYPAEVIYISAQPSPLAGTNNTFIIGNFTSNDTFMVNITVLVRNITNGTLINNTANISYTNFTGTQINLSVAENTTVRNFPAINTSTITAAKTDSPDPVTGGDTLTYSITVTSSGNGTANNVTVNDTYPSGLIYSSAQPTPVSGTNNTFILGNLTPSTSIVVNITLTVPDIFADGTVLNNSVNVTYQNESSGLLSTVATQSTTVSNPPISGGGSGGGGGGGVSYYGHTYTMTTASQAFTLKRTDKVLFTIGTTQHTLTVLRISAAEVLVQVYSQLQQLSLVKNVPQEIDLDKDGKMDVLLTLTSIAYYDAVIKIDILGAECIESWVCDSWGECSAGTQTRECTDTKACGTTKLKPKTSQACTPEPKPLPKPAQEAPPAAVYEPEPVLVVEPKTKAPVLDKVFYALAVVALVALGAYLYWLRRKK